MKTPKLNLSLFRLAAQRLNDGNNDYCCMALNGVFGYDNIPPHAEHEAFENLYERDAERLGCIRSNRTWFGESTPFNRQTRIFALLFAAEFYKGEK